MPLISVVRRLSQAPAPGGKGPSRAWHFAAGLGVALLVACLSAACVPALNWRQVNLQGEALRAMFPCKPERHQRAQAPGGESAPSAATNGGAALTLTLWNCEAEGMRFAVTVLHGPGLTGAAGVDLLQASARSQLAGASWQEQGRALKGWPGPGELGQWPLWRFRDAGEAGAASMSGVALFAHEADTAVQVMVLTQQAAGVNPEALETFLEGLERVR
jgi:hypothetical protein